MLVRTGETLLCVGHKGEAPSMEKNHVVNSIRL